MTEDRIAAESDVVTKLSPGSVHDTAAKLTAMISAKGMKLFAVIDQAAGARQVGLRLRETTLVIFASPKAGTPMMAAPPLAALDLPLKVLIWADEGQTKVSCHAPGRTGCQPPPHRRPGRQSRRINALIDAPVAPNRPDPGAAKARA